MRFILSSVMMALAAPSLVLAQQCAIPDRLPEPQVELPPVPEINSSPTTQYLLALSWSPQFCRDRGSDPKHASQCGGTPFGFILHGLWPDGPGRSDPAWCNPSRKLSNTLVRQHFCMTPSPQLLQHEWSKHGTCMADSPEKYLQAASLLFGAIKYPDMNRLAQSPISVGAFKSFFVAANPGLKPDMLSVQTGNGGWLREVRICLATDLRPKTCAKEDRGARPNLRLRIQSPGA